MIEELMKILEEEELNIYKMNKISIMGLINDYYEVLEGAIRLDENQKRLLKNMRYEVYKGNKNLNKIDDIIKYFEEYVEAYDKREGNNFDKELNKIASLSTKDKRKLCKLYAISHLIYKTYIGFGHEKVLINTLKSWGLEPFQSTTLDNKKIDILVTYKGKKFGIQCKCITFLNNPSAKKGYIEQTKKNIEEGIIDYALVMLHNQFTSSLAITNLSDNREKGIGLFGGYKIGYKLVAIPSPILEYMYIYEDEEGVIKSISNDYFKAQLFKMFDELIDNSSIDLKNYHDKFENELPWEVEGLMKELELYWDNIKR